MVDSGSRVLKCGFYVTDGGRLVEGRQRILDIQDEGLLSPEEASAAVARLVAAGGDFPVAVVLPQSAAVSQVIDLPYASDGAAVPQMENEIRVLTGLTEGRVVHDTFRLRSFGSHRAPCWVTVAKEETLGRYLGPLLAHGIRVEFVTTTGNALLAAFLYSNPTVDHACVVDLGASQTTIGILEEGQPRHLSSFALGGESLTEALLGHGTAGFEELEARLLSENLFNDPEMGDALRESVIVWFGTLEMQIAEWDQEFEKASGTKPKRKPIHLYGGFSGVPGLSDFLSQIAGERVHLGRQVAPEAEHALLAQPSVGAALISSGSLKYRASVLPGSLAKMRLRRMRSVGLSWGCALVFVILAFLLLIGIGERRTFANELEAKNQQLASAVEKAEVAQQILRERDQLARWIAPIVERQVTSLEALRALRLIQEARRDYEFTVLRFADRRTYFQSAEGERSRRGRDSGGAEVDELTGQRSFVVELLLEGAPEERLERLGDIVMRLRKENFFANVDRVVRRGGGDSEGLIEAAAEGTYALMLTQSTFSRRKGGDEPSDPGVVRRRDD